MTAAAAAGGALGASLRWGVGTQLDPNNLEAFAWHTFGVNIIGALLIGIAAVRVRRRTIEWAFIVTGLLGGFTTMSAFAVELNGLADAGRSGLAVLYLVSTLVAGAAALLLGDALGTRADRSGSATS